MRKLSFIVIGVSIIVCLISINLAHSMNTYYSNKQVYNNKIPYSYYFGAGKAKPEKIKVQTTGKGDVVQAVIPVNEEEQKVEQQSIKK